MMLEDLENALAEHAPAGGELASELPPLTIDGIPVSVDKMTQVGHGALIQTLSVQIACLHSSVSTSSRGHHLQTVVPLGAKVCVKVRHIFSRVIFIQGI